jgi:pimeloyl-ACP methyl ester carboxylesterase
MIARILKIMLALQVLAVAGLCYVAITVWHIGQPALALALFCLFLFRLLITAHNFLQSWRFRSPTPRQYRLRPQQRLQLFFHEFAASMLASSWTMAWPVTGWRLADAPVGLPVLLLHGYGSNGGYWTQLSRLLVRQRISHYALDMAPAADAGIDDYVPLVNSAVAELCARTGASQVIIVAHSMGGLVARAWMRRHGSAQLARLITLGTPHHGTALANFGFGQNALQMRRNGVAGASVWLSTLADDDAGPQRALITSIFSHHDNIVAPQTSSYLPGARNIEFAAIGHVALGRDARVLQCVQEEIALASQEAAAAPQGCQTRAG